MLIVVGLTGGIGCGKSCVSKMIQRRGYAVFDADATVHRIQSTNKSTIEKVAARYPTAVKDGKIDRTVLRTLVFEDNTHLDTLEEIFKPYLRAELEKFLKAQRRKHTRLCFRDVPLLFEFGLDAVCTHTVTVYTPRFIQMQRVLRRPGMTVEKFEFFASRQLGHNERNRRADFIIPTGLSKALTCRGLNKVIRHILQ